MGGKQILELVLGINRGNISSCSCEAVTQSHFLLFFRVKQDRKNLKTDNFNQFFQTFLFYLFFFFN